MKKKVVLFIDLFESLPLEVSHLKESKSSAGRLPCEVGHCREKKFDVNFPRRLFCPALQILRNVELRVCVTECLRSQAADYYLLLLFLLQVDNTIRKQINLRNPNYQTVTTKTIGWSKKFFFNPGLYVENGELVRAISNESSEGKILNSKYPGTLY